MNDYSKIANDNRYIIQKQHYENSYKGEDLPIWSKNRPNPIIMSFIDEVLKQKNAPSVLDIGCGLGEYIYLLQDLTSNKLIGLDYVDIAATKADKRIKKATTNSKTIIKNMDFWNFQEKGFDLIIDSGFLHHTKKAHWSIYINKLKEHGNSEFYLILSVFSVNNRLYVEETPKNNWAISKGRYDYYFTEEIVRSVFDEFSVLRVAYANQGEKNETLNFLLKYKA